MCPYYKIYKINTSFSIIIPFQNCFEYDIIDKENSARRKEKGCLKYIL